MEKELKQIEEQIKIAIEVDKALPPVFKMRYKSTLAFLAPSLEVIQDRMLNDDPKFVVTDENYRIWSRVCFEWMPALSPKMQKIVWWRCCGMGWKLMSRLLKKRKYTQVELSRWTLKDLYFKGLEKIIKTSVDGLK